MDSSAVAQIMSEFDRASPSLRALHGCISKQDHLKRIYEASRRRPAVQRSTPPCSTSVVLGNSAQGHLEVRSPQTASPQRQPLKFELIHGQKIRFHSEWELECSYHQRTAFSSTLSARVKLELRKINENGQTFYEITLPSHFLEGYSCGEPASA
jgi:hypothetical protein